jgi:hypothetical protein
MMLSSLAATAMLGLFAVGTTVVAGAQTKNESPTAASRFGISVDGVQKPKAKGLKSQSGKKGGGANYKLQNTWPQK